MLSTIHYEHPDAECIEGVASFSITVLEICFGSSICHFYTSILVTADTHEIIPFLCCPYQKIEEFLNGCKCKRCREIPHRMGQLGIKPCKCKKCMVTEFKTKNQLANQIIEKGLQNFNILAVSFDSWYLCEPTHEQLKNTLFVSEFKSNRWIHPGNIRPDFSKFHGGNRHKKRLKKCGWNKLDIYAEKMLKEGLFQFREMKEEKNSLERFTLQYLTTLWISSEHRVSVLILFDPEEKEFKYLMSNNLDATADKIIQLWRIRWMIEEFHKDAKDLGLRGYQLRKLCSVLIHGQLTFVAYSLLKRFVGSSEKIFGFGLHTIGECSRSLKQLLFYVIPKMRWRLLT